MQLFKIIELLVSMYVLRCHAFLRYIIHVFAAKTYAVLRFSVVRLVFQAVSCGIDIKLWTSGACVRACVVVCVCVCGG